MSDATKNSVKKADAEDALMWIDHIKAESKKREEEILAPMKAIELLFGITQKQMIDEIRRVCQITGKYPTTLQLPPIGGFQMVSSFRGCKLIVGDNFEAKP